MVAIAAVLASQRVDKLRQRVGRKPLPLCLLHREKTNYSKREGRVVAIAAVFSTQREDKLRERTGRKPLPLYLLHREKTN